ncbi:MAG: hypothetical protein H7144_16445 [Burkholderiales bacterium]|nr:hypothetical protein [Phycisphaerae bacterium]
MNIRARLPIIIALILSLIGAHFARRATTEQRFVLDKSRGESESKKGNLSQLNSYALGLLLGGLRGPMLMALWTTSENQKNDRELEDFDTKVELIRLLQAEFDGVHLFQIWNKAYNISVQMANVPTKYSTILDGMDYAFSVSAERTDNINILAAIGGLYFDKFGGAAEKAYFSPRLMDETLPAQDRVRITFPLARRDEILNAARLTAAPSYLLTPREVTKDAGKLYISLRKPAADLLKARVNAGANDSAVEYTQRPAKPANAGAEQGRRTEHDPILDGNYRVLPKFLAPREGVAATGDAADGSELPYLKRFEPYPIGVSPYALAYNYYKRCQWLQKYRQARHAQMSDRVISVRPALALKKWSEEDWYAARRAEIELLKLPVPRDDAELEPVTQSLKLDAPLVKSPLLDEIIWRYRNSSKIADAAVAEYLYHLKPGPEGGDFPSDEFTYRSHLEGSEAQAKLVLADAVYLEAITATGDEKLRLARESAKYYQQAANLFARHILRFYMGDEDVPDVLPRDLRNLNRGDVGPGSNKMQDWELPFSLAKLRAKHLASNWQLQNSDDFKEINSYVERCYARIATIDAFLKK